MSAFGDLDNEELTTAFAMACDERGLTYEGGVRWAEDLAARLVAHAEDRGGYPFVERESK